MTTIQKNGYIFSVDIEKTKEYYNTHLLCDCVCCRNYYAQVNEKLPKLTAFLSEFGVDAAKPDEVWAIDSAASVEYIQTDYTVCGKMESRGECEIDIYDNQFLNIVISDGFVSPNEQTGEYFTISVLNSFTFGWVINKKERRDCQRDNASAKRPIKTVIEKKKHRFVKTSRYYLSNDKWVLMDEKIADSPLLRMFIFRDYVREYILP